MQAVQAGMSHDRGHTHTRGRAGDIDRIASDITVETGVECLRGSTAVGAVDMSHKKWNSEDS